MLLSDCYPKYVIWEVYQAPKIPALAIKNLMRAFLSSKVAAEVVTLMLVSPCVAQAVVPVLRVVSLNERQQCGALYECVSGYSGRQMSIGLKNVQIQLCVGQVDCEARIGAQCMNLQRAQPIQLTDNFGMVLIEPCFCEGECNGVLVLDSTSQPKSKMNCTECQLQVTFNKELVASVQVKRNGICNVCEQMKQIVIQLGKKFEQPQKKKEIPLHPNPNTQTEQQQQEQETIPSTTISEDGTQITGCLDCSEEIHNICHINESESVQYNNRFGRGQFRGRRSFRGRGNIGGQRGRGQFRGRGRSRGRRGRGGNRSRNEDTNGYEFVGGKKIFNPFA
ncbi:MAG: hypothetical protein EZS28_002491 [Streblomastix strix]|uniref:Uncharacterized protein n=1 Tax=Streblomastix strix TaxID=222440 RepID=A0A5J4X3T0_9EUKA|nr:MAG: hypothetical protein EZS28_002491 [Streblomastix strix]